MRDVLMNPKADLPAQAGGPKIHYYMIRGGSKKKNITVWESGTVGGEYIKSYGHYHRDDSTETYEILAGEGYVILQKRGNTDDEIVEFRAVKVKPGDKVFIPAGYGHLCVNTGNTWLVTSDDSPVDFGEKKAVANPGHADYSQFKKLHGAAYYCVEKDGSPTFVKNPHYKIVPEIQFE